MAAAKAVERLLTLTQMPDVGDPDYFVAAATALFAEYPEVVMVRSVPRIAAASDRPTLRLMRQELDDAYAPIAREEARRRAQLEMRAERAARWPRTPEEQARVDAQVARARRELGIGEA